MDNTFPDPKPLDLGGGRLTMWQRSRVVIQQPAHEDACALADSLSETMACDVEGFIAYVNNETGELVDEVVVYRGFYPCKATMSPATEQWINEGSP